MELNEEHLERQIEWSRATFGPGKRTKGVIAHIRKETKEVEDKPEDVSEWIDIMVLAFDGAWRNTGLEPWQILQAYHEKMEKNYSREWPDWRGRSEDEAIEHDSSKDATAATIREGRADVDISVPSVEIGWLDS